MVGLIVQSIQKSDNLLFEQAFLKSGCEVWLAPAEGLYLRQVRFDDYNKKDNNYDPIELDEIEVNKLKNLGLF
jgi:tRNA U38,U39,U40 pseudouridine synthase TruA